MPCVPGDPDFQSQLGDLPPRLRVFIGFMFLQSGLSTSNWAKETSFCILSNSFFVNVLSFSVTDNVLKKVTSKYTNTYTHESTGLLLCSQIPAESYFSVSHSL